MFGEPVTTLERKKDRRGLLALIGAGGVAAMAALLSRNGSAEAGHDATNVFHLGEDNVAGGSQTNLRSDLREVLADGVGGGTLRVTNLATGPTDGGDGVAIHGRGSRHGVFGTSVSGPSGVIGFAGDFGPGGPLPPEPDADILAGVLGLGEPAGVLGVSDQIGVRGTSKHGTGVVGATTGGTGVFGGSAGGTGVRGDGVLGIRGFGTSSGVRGDGPIGVRGVSSGASGFGVFGIASSGKVGVRGDASGAGKTGVLAKATSGAVALKVDGRARFTNAGTATIPAGKTFVRVTGKAFNPGAFALATVQSSPGRDTAVKWVRRDSSTSFTIVLTNPVTKNTKVGYFIVN